MTWKSELDFSSWLDVVADNVHRGLLQNLQENVWCVDMGVAAVKSHMKSKTHASISGSAGSSTQAIRSLFVNPQGVLIAEFRHQRQQIAINIAYIPWYCCCHWWRHPSRGTVDTEGRYVPLFLQQLQWYLSDISSNVSWQWYCEYFHLWSNQVRISDMFWTCSIFPWAAGGYGTKYSMLFDIIRWVYEQDITKRANGLHHQILGRQYQQGGCTIPWVWVSRPCHSCRPFDPFQTMDQPTGSQTTTSGVYGWTKC